MLEHIVRVLQSRGDCLRGMTEIQQLHSIRRVREHVGNKRPPLVQRDMNLAQDNARPHTAPLKEKRVLVTRWEVI